MICPVCRDWRLEDEDAFCAGCGASTLRLRLELEEGGGGRFPVALLERAVPDSVADQIDLTFALAGPEDNDLDTWQDRDLSLSMFGGDTSFPLTDFDVDALSGQAVIEVRAAPVIGEDQWPGRPVARLLLEPSAGSISLVNPELQADAAYTVRNRTNVDGAWVHVRVRNAGPATEIVRGDIKLDRRAEVGEAPAFETAVVLLADESTVLRVWLRPDAAEVVAGLSGGDLTGELRLWGRGDVALGQWPLRLVRRGAMSGSVETRLRMTALAGRPMRLPLRLTNTGGQPFTFNRARLITSEAASDAVKVIEDAASRSVVGDTSRPIEQGAPRDLELRISPGVGQGAFTCVLEADITGAEGDGRTLRSEPFQLTVRAPDHPFAGRICVDFGTTESAAAASFRTPSSRDEAGSLKPPIMIDLVRVSIEGAGRGERFLPSRAAELHDGTRRFGRDADETHPDEIKTPFKGFKWMLKDPDGFEVAMQYLHQLKSLIEEHPDIAAVIGSKATVLATCPTRFPPGMRARLAEALTKAGFPDPRTDAFDRAGVGARVLVAESWSPLPYALFADSERFENLGMAPEAGHSSLDLSRSETGYAIVVDVGGGSADMSVLRIHRTGTHHRQISEVGHRTDVAFVGNAFADDIKRSLGTVLRLDSKSVDEAELAGFVRMLQFDDGVFEGEAMRDFLSRHFAASLKSDDTSLYDQAFVDAYFAEGAAGPLHAKLQTFFPLSIRMKSGAARALSEQDLIDLISHVLADFTRRYLPNVSSMLEDAVADTLEEPGSLLLIPSGRGASYPLARSLLIEGWRFHAGPAEPLCALGPLEAKSITSWGGLYLADLALHGTRFEIDLGYFPEVLVDGGRSVDGRRLLKSFDSTESSPAGLSAATRIVDLLAGKFVNRGKVGLLLGDSQGEDQDFLTEVSISPKRPPTDDQWLVVSLNRTYDLVRNPRVIAAASGAEACKIAAQRPSQRGGRDESA